MGVGVEALVHGQADGPRPGDPDDRRKGGHASWLSIADLGLQI
jgi:hypothetical protein